MPQKPQTIPSQKRNALWPLRREGKGWASGSLAPRLEAALRHLIRTPIGSLPWAPLYGTRLDLYRTQSFPSEVYLALREELRSAIATWIPDIRLQALDIEANPDNDVLIVKIAWGVPTISPGARSKSQLAIGPVTTTITV